MPLMTKCADPMFYHVLPYNIQTTLRAEVKPGKNQFDFSLETR